jgi:hypothetical protein
MVYPGPILCEWYMANSTTIYISQKMLINMNYTWNPPKYITHLLGD